MAKATGLAPVELGAIRPKEVIEEPSRVVRAAPFRAGKDAVGKGKGREQKAKGHEKAKGKTR